MGDRGRRLLVLSMALAAMALAPSAAFAKGEGQGETIEGQALIAGPGLPGGIRLDGRVAVFEDEIHGSDERSELARFLAGMPTMPFQPSGGASGWYELRPDLGTLGPRYSLEYRFRFEDGSSGSIARDLYPYAPGGPMIHVPADEALHGKHVELWWRVDTPELLQILQSHGLPTDAPKAPAAGPADPPGLSPVAAPSVSHIGIWAVAAAGLLALVLAGVAAGRRRQRLSRV